MPPPPDRILRPLLITTLWAVAAALLYLYLSKRGDPVPQPSPLAANLERPITVDFAKVPLEEALETIATSSGLTIKPDWNTLATMGITPADPVTLRLADVSTSAALTAVLAQLPVEPQPVWAEREGQIIVSDHSTLRSSVVRVYNLDDLAAEYVAFRTSMPNEVEPFGVVPTQTVFGGLSWQARAQSVVEISTILLHIDADSWVVNGGNIGIINYSFNRLFITQTPENHRKIQQVLASLREHDPKLVMNSVSDARHGSPP